MTSIWVPSGDANARRVIATAASDSRPAVVVLKARTGDDRDQGQRSASKSRLLMLMLFGCIAAGVVLAASFSTALEYTNTTEFCTSCHSSGTAVFDEYMQSDHSGNHSGVQAQCADCHVPKAFAPKMVRKAMAANDVYQHLLGTIDTPEKFQARRGVLAQRVWDYMKESDSRECRSCHNFSAMDLDEQGRSAKRKHQRAQEKGETCIDCHKGIAHELPDDFG